MCHRVVCPDCGKFTWEGCGLHIAQALAGLSLEQICACDDDKDSEHSWATILKPSSPSRPVPRYPLPYPAVSSSSPSSSSNIKSSLPTTSSFSITAPNPAASGPTCHDTSSPSSSSTSTATPDPIQYKLSKISTTSATTAALRMAAQAEALEELKRIKRQKDQELKEVNQGALQKLLQGLSGADDDGSGDHEMNSRTGSS
ncbi:hypothetical protein MVEG_03242 [Podila verticillata NRRL 6337]|nr:hypothetical protein MVEG_03242 [Podila verticillata NRRL 6337]